jgi:hypothetical protein
MVIVIAVFWTQGRIQLLLPDLMEEVAQVFGARHTGNKRQDHISKAQSKPKDRNYDIECVFTHDNTSETD